MNGIGTPASARRAGWIGSICLAAFLLLSGCRSDTTGVLATDPVKQLRGWVDVKADGAQSLRLQVSPFSTLVTTTIDFDLQTDAIVSLTIFDEGGVAVAKLLDREVMDAGAQEIDFDASKLASGFYIYTLVVQSLDQDGTPTPLIQAASRKMLLIK
jgi:hypothetical protein